MRTHQTIVSEAGVAALAKVTGAEPGTVKMWRRNDSIPAPYWEATVEAGLATLAELAAAAARKASTAKAA